MSRSTLRPSTEAERLLRVGAVGLQLVARAVAQLAERREPEPAREAHDRRGADTPAPCASDSAVWNASSSEMVAQEAEDALVVARQPAARFGDAHVELAAEGKRSGAHGASMPDDSA